jgi:hypothetical protein
VPVGDERQPAVAAVADQDGVAAVTALYEALAAVAAVADEPGSAAITAGVGADTSVTPVAV